ncbi:MAG: hypothetical protein AB1894_19425 [Chloroflexota bacterium]
MKRLKAIIDEVDIIISVAAIILSVIVAILGVLERISFEIVGASILAALSLLAGSILANRRTMKELQMGIEALHKNLSDNASISDFLSDKGYPNLSEDFKTAKSVSILGSNLTSTTILYYFDFSKMVARGASLRYLMPETTPENVAIMAFRSATNDDANSMETAINGSLKQIRLLATSCNKPKLVQLRKIPYVSSYGIMLIEAQDGTFQVYVKLLPYKNNVFPCLKFDNRLNKYWVDFFRDQFESLWKVAEDAL